MPFGPVFGAFGVLIILIGIFSPIIIICVVYYLKKRLEHKQVMAAIEKGMPLSELRPVKKTGPTWIKNLTAGIALLIIAAAVVCLRLVYIARAEADFDQTLGYLFIAIVFFAIGISRLIRGLLQRKAEQQTQPSNGNNGVIENPPGVSNP